MAFVSSFSAVLPASSTSTSSSSSAFCGVPPVARVVSVPRSARVTMLFDATVDEYMASSVHRQYITKACPSGEPPIQCIEGTTSDQPYYLRTLKRQSQLRYRQLPVSVRLHNLYEMRTSAVTAAHNCSHEESRALTYPTMAAAYVLGQAESSKACSRYFHPANPMEEHMRNSVDNKYSMAVNGSGVFSTSCTDGQTKYEAYLMQVRGKATQFRARQYSVAEKEAMKFAARKQALANHSCSAEEAVFTKFPIVAASMRPSFGYYPPFVSTPTQGYTIGVARPPLSPLAPVTTAPVTRAAAVF